MEVKEILDIRGNHSWSVAQVLLISNIARELLQTADS